MILLMNNAQFAYSISGLDRGPGSGFVLLWSGSESSFFSLCSIESWKRSWSEILFFSVSCWVQFAGIK